MSKKRKVRSVKRSLLAIGAPLEDLNAIDRGDSNLIYAGKLAMQHTRDQAANAEELYADNSATPAERRRLVDTGVGRKLTVEIDACLMALDRQAEGWLKGPKNAREGLPQDVKDTLHTVDSAMHAIRQQIKPPPETSTSKR